MSYDPTDEDVNDDHILRFTQRKRKAFIEQMTNEGFPEDPKSQTVMLAALADMDRAALGNKRIGANERLAAADALVAHAITELSSRFGSKNPFEGGATIEGQLHQPDPKQLPDPKPVPGETDIGLSNETFETLVSRFED